MTVRRFVKEYKPIEVIEPFKPDVIQFADPQEFTKYYREHEDEFANMTTYKLNVRYKIPIGESDGQQAFAENIHRLSSQISGGTQGAS